MLRVAWLLLATCHVPGTRAGLRDEVKARAGEGVTLRCAVNKVTGILSTVYWGHGDVIICHDDHCLLQARCGDFHSIKWYKENRRVYVYSPVVDFSKVRYENIFSDKKC